jgi:site-specific DNA-methyltransferase (adenine-specific)
MSRQPSRRNLVLVGDALTQMAQIPDASIDMVLSSPPYYLLRDYGVDGQLGLEASVDTWVDNLRTVARETQRVLVPTGSFWLNISDTYATHPRQGAARKSLLLGPERLTLALLADGWLVRNKIVWAKTNPMPTSVRDRLSASWEALYVFVKKPSYFFDLDAIRVPHTSRPSKRQRTTSIVRGRETWRGPNSASAGGIQAMKAAGHVGHPLGKSPGDVWRIATSNYRGSHHATFPIALAERAIRAGCPEARCVRCRAPWQRPLIRQLGGTAIRGAPRPTCQCDAVSEPGLVLDQFIGAGTTAVAAEQLHRHWLGIELNPDFAKQAEARIQQARAGPVTSGA